ncbi:MAG TPA: trypsin-like peptidase domain-containing protein [Hyphomicrobiaceae bacterium]|nr:trypsin-like peptidase domain-containing protein [Hyphomicrobiaceae bacterium]
MCVAILALHCSATTAAAITVIPKHPAGQIIPNRAGIAVFGNDDRIVLPRQHAALKKSIGLVYSNTARSVCTGFCVADNVIATAAHCLYRTAGERKPDLNHFRFRLHSTGSKRSTRIATVRGSSPQQFILSGSTRLNVKPPIDATRDWALMRLSSPLCRNSVLPVDAATPADIAAHAAAGNLLHVSYHRNFHNWQLAFTAPCTAQSVDRSPKGRRIEHDFNDAHRLVLHTCDTGGGSSGSPLLMRTQGNSFRVVGLNVGTYVQTRMLLEKGKIVRRFKSDAIANTAVAAAAFNDHIALLARAEILTRAPLLRELQRELSRRLLYRGSLDGIFGHATHAAITAFEYRAGLPLTGLATRPLLRRLQSETRTGNYWSNTGRAQKPAVGHLAGTVKSPRPAGRAKPPSLLPAPPTQRP